MKKLRMCVQDEWSWGTRGREKRIFVVAPIELLKACLMFDFISISEYIRSSYEVLAEYCLASYPYFTELSRTLQTEISEFFLFEDESTGWLQHSSYSEYINFVSTSINNEIK